MTIQEFADRYRVRLDDRKWAQRWKLSWSERVIPGRYGEIVDGVYGDKDEGTFQVKFIAVPRNANMTGALRSRYRAALAGGLSLRRKYGEAESAFDFDPASETQAMLAIRLIGARRKRAGRVVTEATLAGLAKARAARQNALLSQKTQSTEALQVASL